MADLVCRWRTLGHFGSSTINEPMLHDVWLSATETIPMMSSGFQNQPENPELFPAGDAWRLSGRLPSFCDGSPFDPAFPEVLPGHFGNRWRDDLFCWDGESVTVAYSNVPPPPQVALQGTTATSLTFSYGPPRRPYGSHLDYHVFLNGTENQVVNGDVAGAFTIGGLTGGTTYAVTVRAASSADLSPPVEIDPKTQPAPQENPPSQLVIDAGGWVGSHQVYLSFRDNTSDELGFHWYVNGVRNPDTIPPKPGVGGTVSLKLSGLAESKPYEIAVAADTPNGTTALSNSVDFTTLDDPSNDGTAGTGRVVIEHAGVLWTTYSPIRNPTWWGIPDPYQSVDLMGWGGVAIQVCNESNTTTGVRAYAHEQQSPPWANGQWLESASILMGHTIDVVDGVAQSVANPIGATLLEFSMWAGQQWSQSPEETYEPSLPPSACAYFDIPWIEFRGPGQYRYTFTLVAESPEVEEQDDLYIDAQCEVGDTAVYSTPCTFAEL